jgi:hypothetical protein
MNSRLLISDMGAFLPPEPIPVMIQQTTAALLPAGRPLVRYFRLPGGGERRAVGRPLAGSLVRNTI